MIRRSSYNLRRNSKLFRMTNHLSTSTDLKFGPHDLHPAQIFYESSLSRGIVNLKPLVRGHILLIPKRVCSRIAELTRDEYLDLFECVYHVAPLIEHHYDCSALNISVQDGINAGQSVPHVHVHILPRQKGDFERNDDIYEKLELIRDDDRHPRSVEEMAAEALSLRVLFSSK